MSKLVGDTINTYRLNDIVGEVYRNGYWLGIVEEPDFYMGTVRAIRVLDNYGTFFYDFLLGEDTYKHFVKGHSYELLHRNASGEYDIHPSRLKHCILKCHMQYCDINNEPIKLTGEGTLARE